MIAMKFALILQCLPIQKAWNPSCIDMSKLFLGNAIPNIVTDFAVVLAPIPMVWNLQVTGAQTIALCGVFLMGGLYA